MSTKDYTPLTDAQLDQMRSSEWGHAQDAAAEIRALRAQQVKLIEGITDACAHLRSESGRNPDLALMVLRATIGSEYAANFAQSIAHGRDYYYARAEGKAEG